MWMRGEDVADAEAAAILTAETLIRIRALVESMQKKE